MGDVEDNSRDRTIVDFEDGNGRGTVREGRDRKGDVKL